MSCISRQYSLTNAFASSSVITPAADGVYTFTYTSADHDGSVYIVTDCVDIANTCVEGSEDGDQPNDQEVLDASLAAGVVAVERARRSLVQVIKDELNEREQYIILNRFGLVGSPVKKNKKTLKQIGEDLDLSKERVRQIELLALQKLRQSLSSEEFELLTG